MCRPRYSSQRVCLLLLAGLTFSESFSTNTLLTAKQSRPHYSRCSLRAASSVGSLGVDDWEKTVPIAQKVNHANDQRYSASDWINNILSLPRSSILKEIKVPVLTVMLWSTLLSVIHSYLCRVGLSKLAQRMCISNKPHSLVVSALGLLLVFRTNSAYQRFTEGRKIWEKILSVSRNISRMTSLYGKDIGVARKHRVLRLLAAFPYLLRHHIQPQCISKNRVEQLRGTNNAILLFDPLETDISSGRHTTGFKYPRTRQRAPHESWVDTLQPSLAELRAARNAVDNHDKNVESSTPQRQSRRQKQRKTQTNECWVDRRSLPWCLFPQSALNKCAESSNRPLWVCDRLSLEFSDVAYNPNFTSRERLTFLGSVDKLSQCIGECERIHQTAVPLNYARHSLRSLTLWLFTLPFAILGESGLLTGPIMGAIAWLLLGVYQIGYTIEDPFQGSLRLSMLCDAIYRDVMYTEQDLLNPRDSAFLLEGETEWYDLDKVQGQNLGGYNAPAETFRSTG